MCLIYKPFLLTDIERTLYDGQHVKVNMTFGLVCESDKDIHTLLKEADEKLYIGKTNGRNQVVS